ncbi:MAG: segregation/condensation protein A [Oscillochloris sp.]|nr:segregation/condensation protein A [Oscillochloris sp.]
MSNTDSAGYTISLPVFEGPLDLLLRLIERSELDITTIALALVADQYLAHVRALPEPDPRQLADFVSMAARLLLIKSRALLPRAPEAARDQAPGDPDAEELARQLREYRRIKELAAVLRAWQDEERRTFLRTAPILEAFPLPNDQPLPHGLNDLIAAVQRRLQLRLPLETVELLALPPRLTVTSVAQRVAERLAYQRWFSFDDLLDAAVTRQDVIVTFWAILELLKRRAIILIQEDLFGVISIGRGDAEADTMNLEEQFL